MTPLGLTNPMGIAVLSCILLPSKSRNSKIESAAMFSRVQLLLSCLISVTYAIFYSVGNTANGTEKERRNGKCKSKIIRRINTGTGGSLRDRNRQIWKGAWRPDQKGGDERSEYIARKQMSLYLWEQASPLTTSIKTKSKASWQPRRFFVSAIKFMRG